MLKSNKLKLSQSVLMYNCDACALAKLPHCQQYCTVCIVAAVHLKRLCVYVNYWCPSWLVHIVVRDVRGYQ